MNHDELRDSYELYALGVAEDPERGEIRDHLSRGCEVCLGEMKRARLMTALLSGTAAAAAPSSRLRRRILASVGVEQKSYGWGLIATAAALLCLVAAVYFNGRERGTEVELARVRENLRRNNVELTRLNEVFSILNAAGTTVSAFGPGAPKGRVFVNPSRGIVLIASNLPPAPAGKIYEAWTVPKGGAKPVPAGLFRSDPDGSAIHVWPSPVDVNSLAAVAVTVEDEAGAQVPTPPILIAAPIQSAPQ
jgi:hypothetical protein